MADSSVRRITWRSADIVRLFGIGVLFLFGWRFFWMVHTALFLALLAVLIAIVLHVPTRFLSRWIPFRVAFPLVLFSFIGGIIFLLFKMIPQLVTQGTELATALPATLDGLAAWYQKRTGQPPSPDMVESVNRQLSQFTARFLPLAFNAISTLLGSVAIIVLAAFLAAQPDVYRALILRVVSPESRPRWERLYDEAGTNLRAWVIGKACTMLGIGIVTWIGLTLFDVPGALALGGFAALMEFIPNFGPTIAAIPAVAAGFTVKPVVAIYVAIFYFLLQQVQNAITVPLVERRAVNIPPAVLLVWQLMLTIGFGIMALFVATPLLAVLVVAIRILYLEPAEERHQWNRREPDTPADATVALGEPPG
ncbi:MAG TPA: AI-2E family transporter [Longimicrobium sp.]|jgi:predicted PurR-regulated permease PerM